MTFDIGKALKSLDEKKSELDQISLDKAVLLSNQRPRDTLVHALREASGCRLAETSRAMTLVGRALVQNEAIERRYLTDWRYRDDHGVEAFLMVAHAEDLIEQALKESCGCSVSGEPAPPIE